MARAKCLISIDGKLVMTSNVTGKRYVFTRRQRELPIDDCDIAQFDAKERRVSSCGCTGGKGVQDQTVKVFRVFND